MYFLDEDEVGDRITVRSDEELKAMLSYVSIYSSLVGFSFALWQHSWQYYNHIVLTDGAQTAFPNNHLEKKNARKTCIHMQK